MYLYVLCRPISMAQGFTATQGFVMVTNVLIVYAYSNKHFEIFRQSIVTTQNIGMGDNVGDLITIVIFWYERVQRGFSTHAWWKIAFLCFQRLFQPSFLNYFIFIAHFPKRKPEPILMVDGLNDAFLHEKCLLGMGLWKTTCGGLRPPRPSLISCQRQIKSQPTLRCPLFKRWDSFNYLLFI